MKAVLTLGCDGRTDDNFCFCSGVTNVVLDLEKVNASANFIDLIKYLDRVTNIFEDPCFETNVIINALYKIHDLGYIDEKKYKFIFHFYEMHKRCGLILKCVPKEI
jgi:hypothetical protein